MDKHEIDQELDSIMDELLPDTLEDELEADSDETEELLPPVEHPEAVLEAVLFSMGNSVDLKKLALSVRREPEETKGILYKMMEEYQENDKIGLKIIELEGAFQMCTKDEMYEHLVKVTKAPKNYVLTDTLLETLSIVAYKQPVTRLEIEKIRGVSCDHAVNKLIEYNLIMELGRLDAPGRPLLFGTTEEFLRAFGVKSLDELPILQQDRFEDFKKEAEDEIQLRLDI
ncbi:MAG TPA: SMC-Scp complex subunit ScpB [Lachnospiraceae bacterium]|nr:SMC-Scp complex subunit ScpB [Lachnospiraceae bacterium]